MSAREVISEVNSQISEVTKRLENIKVVEGRLLSPRNKINTSKNIVPTKQIDLVLSTRRRRDEMDNESSAPSRLSSHVLKSPNTFVDDVLHSVRP